jgi:hypothetical protein
MENKDLGSKKMNNKQSINDDSMNLKQENQSGSLLKSELEIDENGNEKIVDRARNNNPNDDIYKSKTDKKVSAKPSSASEALGKKMVENQDKNSDITPNRLSIPENDGLE